MGDGCAALGLPRRYKRSHLTNTSGQVRSRTHRCGYLVKSYNAQCACAHDVRAGATVDGGPNLGLSFYRAMH